MSQNLTKEQINSFADSIVEVVGAVSGKENTAAVLDSAVRETLSHAIQRAQEIIKVKISGLNVSEIVAICDELEARKRVAFEELYKEKPGTVQGLAQGPLLRVTEAELQEAMEAVKEEEEKAYGEAKATAAKRGKSKRS